MKLLILKYNKNNEELKNNLFFKLYEINDQCLLNQR